MSFSVSRAAAPMLLYMSQLLMVNRKSVEVILALQLLPKTNVTYFPHLQLPPQLLCLLFWSKATDQMCKVQIKALEKKTITSKSLCLILTLDLQLEETVVPAFLRPHELQLGPGATTSY